MTNTDTTAFEHVDDVAEPAAPPVPEPRRRPKDPCGLVFVALSLLFGCAFALITPPLWGFDETTHFSRAYAVDHGRILPQLVPGSEVVYGGPIPETVAELSHFAANGFNNVPAFPEHGVAHPEAYAELLAQPLNAPLVDVGFVNTSSYSPVAYVPSALALRAVEVVDGSVGLALTLMRLADVLAFTGVVWLALRALRGLRFRWVVFVVALMPMTVFVAGMITADALTNALSLLFGALFVKAVLLAKRLSRWETALLFAAAILLPLAKPTYVLLVLLLPLVPGSRMAARRWAGIAATAAGVTGFGIWTALSARTSEGMHTMRPNEVIDPGLQVQYLLTHLTDVPGLLARTFAAQEQGIVTGFFGVFGSSFVLAPATAGLATLAAGALAFGITDRMRATRAQWITSAGVVLVSAAALFGTLYLEFSPVGQYQIEGVQGRYFLPLVVIAVAVLARVIPLRLEIPRARLLRGAEVAIVVLVFYALLSSAFKYEFLL
ncbi:DUF2142 domain-containing protein [Saccharopolyspora sp. TS4A08]|uniref:DUF2142 domain-containing protein n=1 Tax=Saccharopolyspora ipomoeae TaxID=3042027 RepID=A0ABT6PRE0_9PSEU|nr:DUF2142 domain-containing protein [Saccharopolyspora sp. TS4A08]MDI2030011.1 DUF2142 domain-containing protein [Saccharopolyspora sp. TS4A08]